MEAIKEKLVALKQEKEDAVEKLEDAERKEREALERAEGLEQEVQNLQRKLAILGLEGDLDTAEDTAAEKKRKAELEAQVEELARENKLLKRDEEGESHVEDLTEKLHQAEQENDSLSQRVKYLKGQVATLKKDREIAEKDWEKAREEITEIHKIVYMHCDCDLCGTIIIS